MPINCDTNVVSLALPGGGGGGGGGGGRGSIRGNSRRGVPPSSPNPDPI